MTRLIVHLLPYSKILGYKLTYNKCIYLIKSSLYVSKSSIRFLVQYQKNIFLDSRLAGDISKNLHLSSTQGCEPDGDIPDEELFTMTRAMEEEHSELFRNTLYPTSNDTYVNQLKACYTVRGVMDIVNNYSSMLTSEHYCQTILVLWDLSQRRKHTVSLSSGDTETNNVVSDMNTFLQRVLHYISSNMDGLTPEALVCTVLYSNRLGISLRDTYIQTLLSRIDSLLMKEDVYAFSLSALSRLTLSLVDNDELWSKLFLIKTLPYIHKNFDRCSSSEDFRALTISMLSTIPYLTEDLLVEYEVLTEELLRNGTLTSDHTSVLVKAILLLNNIYHKPAARFMVYKLLHMISGNLDKLFFPHFMDLHKVVWKNLEPCYTLRELESIKKTQSLKLHFMNDPTISSLYFYLVTLPTNAQTSLILQNAINGADNLESLLCIQSNLTTAQLEPCNLLWAKVADFLMSKQPVDIKILQRVCLRYMNFTARMGSYHHKQFESHMLSLITTELVEGTAGLRPHVFALLAAFVLSFDHYGHSLSEGIMPRLLSMMDQFGTESCLVLSRGLRQGMLHHKLQSYLQLDSALNQRTRELMNTMDKSSIISFNMILRSCINRKGSLESELLWDILKRLDHVDWSQLTSRSLRNLVYNLQVTGALVSQAMDQMVEYCLQSCHYVTGDTVGKLAYLCYYLGYTPAHTKSFLAITADLISRDRDVVNGLTLLQVALALSYFNHLPPALNHFIFTVTFLERLDDEIKNCFAKAKYPQRVRQTLMQLNRSVCLDQPEADVPWFHTKFCEQQQALGLSEGRPKSLMFTDVLSTLTSIVGNPSCVQPRALTPYGYTLDIQLNLDAALNPVPYKNSENAVHKVAFLLYNADHYTSCDRRLKGVHQMKQRHLEILGYKVIGLSDTLWNSMFMTEPKAKLEYLRQLIWPS
uniref:RAP domain-containing protein n=1 Tax=Graphocephala atropunctata TaxID=36148 RepID=A0A1B6LBE3_9HEMI